MADAPRPPIEAAHAVATLARLAEGRHNNHSERGRRPYRLKLDTGLSLELPGPVLLAEIVFPVLNAGRDLRADGSALVDLATGEPVGLLGHADAVRAFVAALPDDRAAGRPYSDLRLFVAEAQPGHVAKYMADVARAVRRVAPPAPVPERVPHERTKQSPEERRRAKTEWDRAARAEGRELERDDQAAAAAYLFLLQERTGPGVVFAPKDLRKRYSDAVATSARAEEIGRNKFFQVANAVVGPRTRRRIDGKPQPAYVTREVPAMTRNERKDLARLVVQQIADKWEVEARAGLSDLLADLASPSTAVADELPANVVPLRRVA
ncbi:hypothetical protein [Streptomyces chilikensis]|uniref:hypothetical protein n=1 Tax=Streptomyces chilikensis TaxID=1194079 RepID=UPI000AEAF29F|nr:hypothetical protein [Streptomyces chilikensis]